METVNEEVEEVKNEEVNEVVNTETNEEARQTGLLDLKGEAPKEEQKQEEEVKTEEVEEQPKAKAKPKKQARSVKVVELVSCPDCDKKMLPKSLRHSHPRNCKGQPTETRPINKQQNSYGSKIKEQMRKEIEEEMKTKYSKQGQPKQEEIKQEAVKYVRMEEAPPQHVPLGRALGSQTVPTARELLASSYAEIRRAKQQEKMEKIARFKTSMF